MVDLVPIPLRLIAPGWERRVPAPAHDSLDPVARRRYIETHPDSYLTVTRSPDDLEPGEVWNAAAASAASKAALRRLLERGAFTGPRAPALHLYRLTEGDHTQLGIVGGVAIDDYDRGRVRIHERIKPQRAAHLAAQLGELGVQSSPVTLAHRPDPGVSDTAAALAGSTPPILDVTSPDGLRQQVWEVVDHDAVAAIRSALTDDVFYLIDGHHRAAAASSLRATRSDEGRSERPDLLLCTVFSTSELRVEAFHRWLPRVDPSSLLTGLEAATSVRVAADLDAVVDRSDDELALWTGGRWYLVTALPTGGLAAAGGGAAARTAGAHVEALDPVRLDQRILAPLFGIDQANPGDELGYLHGMADRADLERLESVATGAVWAMRPVPMDALLTVSDAGLTMPPKSTYFVPKVRSGVFLRLLYESS